MGRNAIPIENVKKHLTNEEKEFRKNNKISVGESLTEKIKPPTYVEEDQVAMNKWIEIINELSKSGYASSTDIGILSRYCRTFSEYLFLLQKRDVIINLELQHEELDAFKEEMEKENVFKTDINKILKLLKMISSLKVLNEIGSQINKKLSMLNQMEDRLFLNPLAKVKNVPKQVPKENEEDEMFQ